MDTEEIRKVLNDLAEHFQVLGDAADLADHAAWEYDAAEEIEQWRDKHFPADVTD